MSLLDDMRDPLWFVPQMIISDRQGNLTSLQDAVDPFTGRTGLYDEQWQTLEALVEWPKVCVLKARKLGITTIGQAYFVHRAITRPGSHNVLCIGHEEGSCRIMNRMQDVYLQGIQRPPRGRQPGMGFGTALFDRCRPTNTEVNTLAQGLDESALVTLQAGGRGSGRSYTFHSLHGSENAYYPRGSSAAGLSSKNAEETADHAMWAGALSSMTKDGNDKLLAESTANGPGGLFHDICKQAQREQGLGKSKGQQWKFLFFPWFRCHSYQTTPWDGFEYDDDEKALAERFPEITVANMAWRRLKITSDGYSLSRFQREYPNNEKEPFLYSGNLWYPTLILNEWADALEGQETPRVGWRYFVEPPTGQEPQTRIYQANSVFLVLTDEEVDYRDPERRYFIGGDASGGVGKDDAVLHVIDDTGVVAAVWSDNRTDPDQFAHILHRESLKWSTGGEPAVILVSKNNHGGAVIKRLLELGARIWMEGTDTNPQAFWEKPETRLWLVTELRTAILNRWLQVRDPETIEQLLKVKETKTGNVKADEGDHDDHADSLAMAWWCARLHIKAEIGRRTASQDRARIAEDRAKNLKRRQEGKDGGRRR